jgi:hypothetical protein
MLAARRAWLIALAPWLCATGFRRFCSEQRRTRLSTAGGKTEAPASGSFGTSTGVALTARRTLGALRPRLARFAVIAP